MGDSDEEIAEDVLPLTVVEMAVPVELTQLQPWHKPRKQFIRRDQWGLLSQRLIQKLKGNPALPAQVDGSHEVKYLTLPGSDYLDVEMIAELAKQDGCVLTCTGFLAATTNNPIAARAELRQASLIDAEIISKASHTFSRRIEEIAPKGSAAYRELQTRGPFHIINLDACGSIAPPGAPDNNRMINVIHRLLEYQFAHYSGRWLLFVTADVRSEQFDEQTIENLYNAIRENARTTPAFREAATAHFGEADAEFNAALTQFSGAQIDNFMQAFSLGFGKWMLALADAKGWSMKMHRSYCYSTTPANDERATMPCLAFEFVPPDTQLNDPFGIAANNVQAARPSYAELAMRVLEKVFGMENLDQRLSVNEQENAELLEETRERLQRAGYTPDVLQALT